ncbi:MAG: glutathione S-transferase family protein [Candidatus Dadabacteria bacterium]
MPRPVLVIGNKNYSSWSLRPWIMLKHLGVDFDEVRIPLYIEGSRERILEYSPAGKVPVYIDGGVTVWESLAIMEYLAESRPGVWPAGKEARAMARSIGAEMHAGFTALRDKMPHNCRAVGRQVTVTPGLAKDVERVIEIWETSRRDYGGGGQWLFGEFSAADAMYAPVVFRFRTYGVTPPGLAGEYMEAALADPHMQDWLRAGEEETEVLEFCEVGVV